MTGTVGTGPNMSQPLAIEYVPLADLRENPRNSREHSDEQIEQIAASLREFGWAMPMLADESGELIAGHGRRAGALLNGWAEGPVIRAIGWSDDQKRAYMIADNRLTEASTWDDEALRLELNHLIGADFDISLTGMTDDDLTRLSVGVEELGGMPEISDGDRSPFRQATFILLAEQEQTIEQAIALAAPALPEDMGPNKSVKGNALAMICREYIEARVDHGGDEQGGSGAGAQGSEIRAPAEDGDAADAA